ncbi:MAG: hypothetical protein ACE14W_03745 [Candidatus Velamenicoccus archaeovorus]
MASKQRTNPGSGGGRVTKAERKEQARRERLELQRKMARSRRNRRIVAVVGVLAVAAVVAVLALNQGSPSTSSASSSLDGMLTGPGPWPANTADLAQRLNALALPPEGTALHNHAFLAVVVDGSPQPVAANIGLSASAASPLHTHDSTGVIHIESGDPGFRPTLGEFFDVWGVQLTSSCVGGYCDTGGQQVRVFVNGDPFPGNPRTIPLTEHADIVVTYGTEAQVPETLPAYDWSTFQG